MTSLSLPLLLSLVALSALVIVWAGTALAREADRISAAYSFSAGLVGAVLLGATTSLPGTVVSVSAAWKGNADLAIANAIGGLTAQTAFLAVADMVYRRQNLEYAAASISTVMQCALLIALLAVPLAAYGVPNATFGHVHLFTPAMLVAYVLGLKLIDRGDRAEVGAARGR